MTSFFVYLCLCLSETNSEKLRPQNCTNFYYGSVSWLLNKASGHRVISFCFLFFITFHIFFVHSWVSHFLRKYFQILSHRAVTKIRTARDAYEDSVIKSIFKALQSEFDERVGQVSSENTIYKMVVLIYYMIDIAAMVFSGIKPLWSLKNDPHKQRSIQEGGGFEFR